MINRTVKVYDRQAGKSTGYADKMRHRRNRLKPGGKTRNAHNRLVNRRVAGFNIARWNGLTIGSAASLAQRLPTSPFYR
jgi:hypothetical protein